MDRVGRVDLVAVVGPCFEIFRDVAVVQPLGASPLWFSCRSSGFGIFCRVRILVRLFGFIIFIFILFFIALWRQ